MRSILSNTVMRSWARAALALLLVAGMVSAQASHLFHTHDLENGTSTCIACFHQQTQVLSPDLVAGPAPVVAFFLLPVRCGHRPAAACEPLDQAPKTSPPFFC